MDEARKVLSDASKRNGRDIEPDKIGTKNISKQRRLLETAVPRAQKMKAKCDRIAPSHPLSGPVVSDLHLF